MPRALRHIVTEGVSEWLRGLTFTDAQGAPYHLATVVTRRPKPGDAAIGYPMATVTANGSYDNQVPEEVPGSRDPETGAGTYLERTGELVGELAIVLYANDEDLEDELVAGIENALVPLDAEVPRVVLPLQDYHGIRLVLRRKAFSQAQMQEAAERYVFRPVITCDYAIAIVRERQADDFRPAIGNLDVDGDAYLIDIDAGTTTKVP